MERMRESANVSVVDDAEVTLCRCRVKNGTTGVWVGRWASARVVACVFGNLDACLVVAKEGTTVDVDGATTFEDARVAYMGHGARAFKATRPPCQHVDAVASPFDGDVRRFWSWMFVSMYAGAVTLALALGW